MGARQEGLRGGRRVQGAWRDAEAGPERSGGGAGSEGAGGGTRMGVGAGPEGSGAGPEGSGGGAEREARPRASAPRSAALSPALYPRIPQRPGAAARPHHAPAARALLCAAALRRVAGRGDELGGHIGSSKWSSRGLQAGPGRRLQSLPTAAFGRVAAGQATGREGTRGRVGSPLCPGTASPLLSVPSLLLGSFPIYCSLMRKSG